MRIKHFSQSSFYRQLAILGFVSLSACVCQVSAAELGPQSGGDITLQDNDVIVATGSSYSAINSTTTGHVDLANGVTINMTGNGGVGIRTGGANNDSTFTANALTINVDGMGGLGMGISIDGGSLDFDLGQGSTILATDGIGIRLLSQTASLKADGLTIEASGAYRYGIYFQRGGASVDLGDGSLISTSGYRSAGIIFNDSEYLSRVTANGLTIKTQGEESDGIVLSRNAVVDLGCGSSITTSGDRANGISSVGGGTLTADALMVHVSGVYSSGLDIHVSGNEVGGTMNIGAGSHVSSDRGYAISVGGDDQSLSVLNYLGTADNRNILSSDNFAVATAYGNASLNLAYTDINVNSGWTGLYSQRGATISAENVTINSKTGSTGIYLDGSSHINLSGDVAINMEYVTDWAIVTQDDCECGYAPSTVDANGKLTITGGVISRGGLVGLNMRTGSVWSGQGYSDNANDGYLNVTMQDSLWNVSDSSKVDKLALANSTIDFASRAQSSSDYSILQVANLSGNGTFIMRADIVGDGDGVNNSGDLLKVTGTSAGNHLLTINNQGSMATTGNEVLTVVETADGAATFAATSQVELGGYLYDVRKNGNNWELYASSSAPLPTPDPDPTPTSAADAGGNYLNVGYLMNYAENQTLMQRMGDLRQSGERGNVWIRGYGGKFGAFASGKLSGFDMGYSGVQFGADKRISVETPLFIGLFIGSTHASPDYRGGGGTASSDYMGMYASYMAQGGFYSDLVLKAARQKNGFSVLDSQNNGVNADGSASGFSTSLEAGKKISLNQTGSGFYVEPQAQFTYSHQNAMDMKASNGLNIDLSSYESMLGRASVLLGYETMAGGSKVNVYLKTGALREFSGDTDYRLNGSKEKHCFKGNGWNNGLGISAQISGQHTLYLEADYTSGNAFEQRQVNGGYRFSF
ncbi:autotransporter outer membrane beta-barrel domain-containing protein [Leminorella grimontii]|uniref:autotransporter outer membrane beta-barrel domain-containing protein n=1 Tax=Leminorella grimontii TaxID=82981 RepID=UPI00207F5191|nr:autotransporter outer membrane beta-barrel domain-containing protein [Leminorella grimontii]GKX58280.1 outer membrane autotransporter barrel domain-containing protein [Leminorella grimontii]